MTFYHPEGKCRDKGTVQHVVQISVTLTKSPEYASPAKVDPHSRVAVMKCFIVV